MPFWNRKASDSNQQSSEPEEDSPCGSNGFYFDASHDSSERHQAIVNRIQNRRENAMVNAPSGQLEVYANGYFVGSYSDGLEADRMYRKHAEG